MIYYYSNMKKLITFVCILSITFSGVAQVDYVDYSKKELKRTTAAERVSASLCMVAGMGFSNSTTSPTTLTTYLAPAVGYQFSKKFELNVGLIHYDISGNFFNNSADRNKRFRNNNGLYHGNVLQLQGQYLLNEKTQISGGILYNLNSLYSKQSNYKAATLSIDYKLTPHAIFSIQTIVSQGNGNNLSPYSNYPFGTHPLIPTTIRPTMFNTSPVNF